MVIPALSVVTSPEVLLIVATEVFELLHEPPEVTSFNVVVDPLH